MMKKFSLEEENFLNQHFLSPSVSLSPLSVRIEGIFLELRPTKKFTGWGIFKPTSYKECELIREATSAETKKYLSLFTTIKAVAYNEHSCFPINYRGTSIDNYNFCLCKHEVKPFYIINCIDYGGRLIFKSVDRSSIKREQELKAKASELDKAPLSSLKEPWLSIYSELYEDELAQRIPPEEIMLREQIKRAGGTMHGYKKLPDGTLEVDYTVEIPNRKNFRNKSTVSSKGDVILAGICLGHGAENMVSNGELDINSLVHVAREAVVKNRLVKGNYQ